MEPGDIVYRVEVNNAKLSGQGDGVELFEAEITLEERGSHVFAKVTKLLRFIGAYSYSAPDATGGKPFSNIGSNYDTSEFLLFTKLSEARQYMIKEIFKKKKWLPGIKVL